MRTEIAISEVFGPTIQGEGALIGRPTVFVRTGGCDSSCHWCDTLYAVLPEYRADWQPHSASQILDRVFELSNGQPILITLSGGNPALQPLQSLIELGHARGCRFALETQGTVAKMWFSQLDYLILSPKPPSSKMVFRPERLAQCVRAARSTEDFDGVQKVAENHQSTAERVQSTAERVQSTAERVQSTAERCGPSISLKIVIFGEADYQFARGVAAQFGELSVYLQVGNPTPAQPNNNWTGESGADGARAGVEWLIERVMRDGWSDVTILPQLHVLLWGNARGV